MSRFSRPVTPAPNARVRYPRVGAVWSAFTAGTLGVVGLGADLAHADCALPAHAGAVAPTATPAKSGGGKKSGKQAVEKRPEAPVTRPPLPGAEPAVVPPVPGGPVRVRPLDGKIAPVGRIDAITIHPHGPDEPCHRGGDRSLVIRFT